MEQLKNIVEQKFIINEKQPIIPQLEAFAPGKGVDYTALQSLTNPTEIKKFFAERVQQFRADDPNNNSPEETLRSNLAYIAGSGSQYLSGFKIFKEVLSDEFDKVIKGAVEKGNLKMQDKK